MKLNEVAEVIDSLHETPTYTNSGYPMIRVTDIKSYYFNINSDIRYVSESDFIKYTKKKIPAYGDIIMTRVGSYGSVSFVNEKEKFCLGQNTVLITNFNNEINNKYLFYKLISKEIKNQIESFVHGSTQKTISLFSIRNIEIKIPEITVQTKIVSILSSLDKKIEINNKIIENLEAQAQAIFKSWFVDFEPFQNGNFVESELGLIPEGWEVGKLGKSKLGKIIGSGIDEFVDKKIYLATADVSDTSINNTSTKITFDNRPSRANMQPKPLSVWFAKMKDSRKLIFVDTTDKEIISKMIFSTGFAGIQANEDSFTYLWAYLLSDDFDKIKNAYAMGTTMQAINNKNINNILIAIPADSILKEFSTITRPMIEIISNLRNQNEKLAQTRYTLLPKLMSGEIDVSNIKIDDEDIDYE